MLLESFIGIIRFRIRSLKMSWRISSNRESLLSMVMSSQVKRWKWYLMLSNRELKTRRWKWQLEML